MNANELARHVDSEWEAITGLPNAEKHQESEFPEEVMNLLEEHGVDYVDFCDAWTELHG